MISILAGNVLSCSPSVSLLSLLQFLESTSVFQFAVIVSDENKLLGVVNQADVIRLISSGVALDCPCSSVMVIDPIFCSHNLTDIEIVQSVRVQSLRKYNGQKESTRFVPLVDHSHTLIRVIDVFELLTSLSEFGQCVEVYGLGFVGLTLAASLASRGHYVTGIDVNKDIVDNLNIGISSVFEPRLPSLIRKGLSSKHLSFTTIPVSHHRYVIISVGTPILDDGSASLDSLESCLTSISTRLRKGDIVMLRSTVPVGTTRNFVIPLLENGSCLKAGIDFSVAFTPERTVEGKAIQELSTLPQIIGGYTDSCLDTACKFWKTLSNKIVTVQSLEAAELVKLINNSYRDLSFAFANSFALLADTYNLDSSKIISAANDGYPRNPIPFPSPGVGGYCLSKDPFLYAYTSTSKVRAHSSLSQLGRSINLSAGHYPIIILERFAQRMLRQIDSLYVHIAGIAFKGIPETNDLRGSSSLSVALQLSEIGCQISVSDAIVSAVDLQKHGLVVESVDNASMSCDAFLILNNHPNNIPDYLLDNLSTRASLLFDGWSLYDRFDVEQNSSIVYSNMGYMTPSR